MMSRLKKIAGATGLALITTYFFWPTSAIKQASATAPNATPNQARVIEHKPEIFSPTTVPPKQSVSQHNTESPTQASLSPIERIRAIQNKTELHTSLIADHEQFTRYPSYNKVFTALEKDPIAKRYEVHERSTQTEDKRSTLTIWADSRFYLSGETATFFAVLRDENNNAINTRFAAQVIFEEHRSIAQLEFQPSPGNDYQQAQFPLNDKSYREGIYKVLVVNQTNELVDAVTFTLSQPDAHLTGEYSDQIFEGSLRIMAELEVAKPNRFYLEASLYSSTNDPIGTTQNAQELPIGTHWVTLDFSGLMLIDSGEPAPFVLKHISLAKVAMPIQRAPLVSPSYITEQYDMNEFSVQTSHEQDKL